MTNNTTAILARLTDVQQVFEDPISLMPKGQRAHMGHALNMPKDIDAESIAGVGLNAILELWMEFDIE